MSSHESTSTLDAALDLASRGFPVFPVSRQKRPLVSRNWHEIATCDGNRLRSWWNQFPGANPAIVADGLLVVDTDGPTAEELLASFPVLPSTYTVRTARGHHRYFRLPPGVEVRNVQLGHNIDVKTAGGYVVGAGAIHESGVVYTVVDDAPIETAPAWLIDRLGKNVLRPSAPVNTASAAILRGDRNNKLTTIAGKLRHSGLDADAIGAALMVVNRQQCAPSLPEREVLNIARSVGRYDAPAEPVLANDVTLGTRDMPVDVLDGRLGDICRSRMEGFPIAYAWPALLAVASAMVPMTPGMPERRDNLYVGLVGPVHSGKTQANQRACELLGISAPTLMDRLSGSAEDLIKRVADVGGAQRLLSPDELGHLLEKSKIDGASFPFVLNKAYYSDTFEAGMARGREVLFNCRLSLVGGVVDEDFEDLFGAKTTGGLHDRFLFGVCPSGFAYDYFPFNGIPALRCGIDSDPVLVTVSPDVWAEKSRWLKADPSINPRLAEIAIRAAAICASFDGRGVLRPSDLGPAFELVRYQSRVRSILRPNPGKTYDAQLAYKILEHLRRVPSGQWVEQRNLLRAVHADRFGPGQSDRTLASLDGNGDVERMKLGRRSLVRLACDEVVHESKKDTSADI